MMTETNNYCGKHTSCNGNLLQTLQENTVFSVPELTTHTLASVGISSTLMSR